MPRSNNSTAALMTNPITWVFPNLQDGDEAHQQNDDFQLKTLVQCAQLPSTFGGVHQGILR